MLRLDDATAGIVDDDARLALDSMRRELQDALCGVVDHVRAEVNDDALTAYVHSLQGRDDDSWRRFFAAIRRVVAVARTDVTAEASVRARMRLRSLLDENEDLAAE